MIDIIKVIILGIVEGLTEFLPISSTGHLIVVSALLNFENALGGTFEIFIQFGAVVAVVIYFREDLFQKVRALFSKKDGWRFWLNLLIAAVPAGLVGFLFIDDIKAVLFNPAVVAISLIVGGVIFLLVERTADSRQVVVDDLSSITPVQALIVGIIQILAVIPGVSRSGATIIGGMMTGWNRAVATRFSFYLAIPILGGATVYDLVKSLDTISSNDLMNLIVGAVVSGLVAWISIRWLLTFVARNSFVVFGYYRIAAGVIILLILATGIVNLA